MFIKDVRSGRRLLIDSGAEISVMPPVVFPRHRQMFHSLLLMVQKSVRMVRTYYIGFSRIFSWSFEMADVSRPIIGADFLHYFGLLIDIRKNRLIDPTTD